MTPGTKTLNYNTTLERSCGVTGVFVQRSLKNPKEEKLEDGRCSSNQKEGKQRFLKLGSWLLIPSKVLEQITKKVPCIYLRKEVAVTKSLHGFPELSHAKAKLIIFSLSLYLSLSNQRIIVEIKY